MHACATIVVVLVGIHAIVDKAFDVVEPRVRFFPARGRRAGAAPSRARPHRAGVDALTDLAPFLVSRAGERGLKQTLCHPNPPTRGWNARRGRLARASPRALAK